MRSALVIGAQGALGKAVIEAFNKSGHWSVLGVDVVAPNDATPAAVPSNTQLVNFSRPDLSIEEMQQELLGFLKSGEEVSAVVNAAGGWAGGSVRDESTAAAAELMLRQSLFSSFAAAHVFATRGSAEGVLTLVGAAAAEKPTPGMLGYGTAKAAVHFLCRSVAADPTALPTGAKVLAVLPTTLDTPGNRSGMPDADTSSWTPLPAVAEQILLWSGNPSAAPASGSLVEAVTTSHKSVFRVIS
uniref:Dihydropteridine reductase n=1 Tax=Herpetomonas muscarum TaxID=5718 RepID=T1YS44_HERMU|nr:6,7-dihydropteridine reductase [Herpetomonas muscarum]